MELVIQTEGSALGGGGALHEMGGGWIVRRAEETAVLALVEKLLRISESYHAKVLRAYELRKDKRDARLNGEAAQILRVADQVQLIILNAIRNKTKCQN